MTVTLLPQDGGRLPFYNVRNVLKTKDSVYYIEFVDQDGNINYSLGIPFIVIADNGDKLSLGKDVDWFAQSMEKILRANSHKGHWGFVSVENLLIKLEEEYEELRRSVLAHEGPEAVLHEATDLANVAMMLADNVRG